VLPMDLDCRRRAVASPATTTALSRPPMCAASGALSGWVGAGPNNAAANRFSQSAWLPVIADSSRNRLRVAIDPRIFDLLRTCEWDEPCACLEANLPWLFLLFQLLHCGALLLRLTHQAMDATMIASLLPLNSYGAENTGFLGIVQKS